jgi:NAD(P)H dehydrogenase (quinone)
MMGSVAIIYFSGIGNTHLMAEAIAAGVHCHADTRADLLRIEGVQIKDGRWFDEKFMETLQMADAILFGSPTYMGGAAAQFKAFADFTSETWFAESWKDKLAGGFTHGAALSGDKLNTLIYFSILAAQHGMVWVNPGEIDCTARGTSDETNRLGSYLGVMGQAYLDFERKEPELHPGDRLSCEHFGQHIAKWVHRIK